MRVTQLLGIRHHGPGSARSAVAALERFRPDVVCIEGPPEAEAIAGLAEDPGMVPPVALLGYVADDPARAAFWPLASFSPEWQALRWAQRHGRPFRFIDLPASQSLAQPRPEPGAEDRSEDGGSGDPLGELASAAGFDDVERWWDDLVEHRADDVFEAIADAMAAVREDRPAPTGREAQREAHMRECLRAVAGEGFERAAVVCGAWHVPALAGLDASGAAQDAALLRNLPKAKVVMTWVPWSSRRLAAATGYGAGVQAPGWYHHLFVHAGPEVIARWFCEVAAVLRAGGHPASPAQIIDAARLADALATLRLRPLAGLSEVTEATAAVLGEGGSAPMALVHDALVVGAAVGSVPDSTPMVPLARDLTAWQRRLRLKPEDRTLELDLRRPAGRERSRLLHRLTVLGVPWGTLIEGRGAAGTFRETWRLCWEPELSVRLVERSAFGTTVEAAAAAYAVQVAQGEASLAELTRAVEGCLLADLPGALVQLMEIVADRAAVHADVPQLMDALGPLARARRYGDVRGTDTDALDSVLAGMVVRVSAGLRPACTGIDAEAAALMAGRLQATQAALALLADPAHTATWHGALLGLLGAAMVPGMVQGRACRQLLDAEQMSLDEAGRRLARAVTPGTPPAEGAAFVEGFLAGSGTVLVHDRTLLSLLDDWLARLPADGFTDALPLLRRTFATFEPSERRLIGELVRRGPASASASPPVDHALDEERAAAALATMVELLGVSR
ncbi:MAG TPA: DUF5682 family protein [Acidimicrobiales bacterium]